MSEPLRLGIAGLGTVGASLVGVLRAVTQVNPVTVQPYVWLLLKTRAAVLDVFADPCAIRGGVEAGAIAQVCGSFTGQLVDLGAQSAGALSLPQLQQAKVVAFPARR